MAVKLTRENFGELLTPVHRKVFYDAYESKKTQFDKTFKTDDELPEIEMLKKIMLQNKKIINQNKIIIDLLKKQGENND
mgnify:CR=1 FL=1